jgi:hypothetical protein
MHDLMHDLAKQVAGDDCCYLDDNSKGCLGRPVHLWVKLGALYLLKSLDASRLRTLIVFSSRHVEDYLLDGEKQSIISTFKYLRVLKLCNIGYVGLCVSIENLKHLRFLDIYGKISFEESLHKSIGNFVCLQTIKVRLYGDVVFSTKVVSKLINLRHLYFRLLQIRDKTPVGFGKLSIQQHGGVIFSKWLSPLTNIIEISLTFCEGVQFLPPLERLPFLKSLRLMDMIALEYIYYEELILHEPFFPSLKRLDIRYCNKLVGWKSMRDDFNDINTSSHHLLLTPFRCLSFLEINQCPMLTHMPTCPTIKKLALEVLPVEKLLYHVYASQYSISCNPLSMLQSLQIQETIMDVKNVPQYWWQNLTSLENLEFRCLSSEHFQAIEIWFKGDINYLPSLQKITFERCLSLKALPDWICNISSLQHIKVEGCHELALLPEGMPRLTNLHSLKIIGNVDSLLIEECQKETSATWSKIAHIPNIIIIPILQRYPISS